MSEDNSAKKIQYLEVDEQRSLSSGNDFGGGSNDFEGSYLSKEISIFGKLFIGFMILTFLLSFAFLVFSYTPYGVDFLRGVKIHII